jgi:hypothetical protein
LHVARWAVVSLALEHAEFSVANILAIAGPNSKYNEPGAEPAGFLAGLWHGLIFPIVFFVSLVNSGVRIYEKNNSGRWYDFGFLIGASSSLGGGGHEASDYTSNNDIVITAPSP